jgi:hypothetical protein
MSTETAMLGAELLMLKTRYDFYAFSPAIYAVVKNIETEVHGSSTSFGCDARSPPSPYPAGRQQRGVNQPREVRSHNGFHRRSSGRRRRSDSEVQ